MILEILRELVPGLKRVHSPYAAGDPLIVSQLDGYRQAARLLGLTLVERPVHSQPEAETVLRSVQKTDVGAILSPRYLSLNIPGFIVETGLREKIPGRTRQLRGGPASTRPAVGAAGAANHERCQTR